MSSLLEDSKFYKYIVNEKVDHINNVVFGVLCLTISAILNKISILILSVYERLLFSSPGLSVVSHASVPFL